jgi:hypothetical protein
MQLDPQFGRMAEMRLYRDMLGTLHLHVTGATRDSTGIVAQLGYALHV